MNGNTYESLLAYVIGELEELGFGTDKPIDGSDCVETVGLLYEVLLAERDGRSLV
jgi:hypothetical protein